MPRFSIVVPAYNAEATLAETLDAVLAQEFRDWECVVVDDGSTDGTRGVALALADRDARLRVLSQANQGTAGAYNTAVGASDAPLIVVCSADDLLLPDHLAVMARLVEAHPEHGIYSSNGYYLYETGAVRSVYDTAEWRVPRSLTLKEVLTCCFFSVGAVYRREVFDLVGGYRRGVYGEDYDFWLRAMAAGATQVYTPELLSMHRVSSTQKSADLLRVYRSNVEAYEHLLDSGLVRGERGSLVKDAITARLELIETVTQDLARESRLSGVRNRLAGVVGARAAAALTGFALRGYRKARAWLR